MEKKLEKQFDEPNTILYMSYKEELEEYPESHHELDIEKVKSFIDSNFISLEEVEELLKDSETSVGNKHYDGNNLQSAGDFYCIAPENWSEIIRYENGHMAALSDIRQRIKERNNA